MLEKRIETKLVEEVDKLKGQCLKLNSQSANGVPDRLVLLPGKRLYFIELKRPGKKLQPLQLYWKNLLNSYGFPAIKIDSLEDVDKFIREVR